MVIIINKMTMQKNFTKIVADVSPEEIGIIDNACNIENRSRANFIRTHCKKIALKIIDKNKQEEKTQ